MTTEKSTQKKVEEVVEETVNKAKKTAKETAGKAKKTAAETSAKAKKVAEETSEKAKKVAEETAVKTKRAAAKTRSKVAKVSVKVQYQGLEADMNKVVSDAQAAYAAAYPENAIKTLDVYVKPEEGVAYYVVNGEGSDDFKVSL